MADGAGADRLVLRTEPGYSVVVTLAWMAAPVAALSFVIGVIGVALASSAPSAAVLVGSAAVLVVCWRLIPVGVTATSDGVRFRRVLSSEIVAVGEIERIELEPVSLSQVSFWLGPYRDRVRGVIVAEGQRRLHSSVLVGGTKKRGFNPAPSAELLRDRLERIAATLDLHSAALDRPTAARYPDRADRVVATKPGPG